MGFDPDARDADGLSAMDIALGAPRGKHCHPRAVRVLLEAGADPDAINFAGDAPLLAIARSEHWCEDRDACARALIEHGADMHAAKGGDTLASLLRAAQETRSSSARAALLASLEDAQSSAMWRP